MESTRVRIVLVRPEEAGNVGAAARVMKNFGLAHLVLVDPRAVRPAEALKWGRKAGDILEGADVVPDLTAALAGCATAWAVTRRGGRDRGRFHTPREAAAETGTLAGRGGAVAWVFGPEARGLASEEVELCAGRVTITTSPRQPSLNLAQAVAVCCYELSLAGRSEDRALPAPASFEDRESMYAHWARALASIDFLRAAGPTRLRMLRALVERGRPTPPEVRFLRGIARRVLRAGKLARGRS